MLRPYVLTSLFLSLVLLACDNSDSREEDGALFLVRACRDSAANPNGETFRVLIRDPEVAAEADRLIASGERRILSGRVVRGDGGFNEPWSWHIDPDSVGFADITIELCDGCPHYIEEDLTYWTDTVRYYCPWSTEIVRREE